MGNVTNTTFGNILLLSALGASSAVISFGYDQNSPAELNSYGEFEIKEELTDWDKDIFLRLPDYYNQEKEKIETIINFSKKIADNSYDIDSEFIDIVNENFWDLI